MFFMRLNHATCTCNRISIVNVVVAVASKLIWELNVLGYIFSLHRWFVDSNGNYSRGVLILKI